MKEKIYVVDKIKEEYKSWKNGDVVIVDCQTGQGKTYFILNTYSAYLDIKGKNILILSNRIKLKEDLKEDASQMVHNNIDVINYQALENMILNDIEISHYDCIVCDECHYFLSDAWNNKTDVSWKWVKEQADTIRIFMSATGSKVFNMVKKIGNKPYEYRIPRDYSYINKLYFYENDSYIVETLRNLSSDEKAIVFCNSVETAYNRYLIFKDSASFKCSERRNPYNKYITENAIQNERFSSQILFATSCIDNGINLKDRAIKHIFIDMVDLVTLIQCLGRKRILDEGDTITFHIKNYTNKQLNGYKKKYNDNVKSVEAYIWNDAEALKKISAKREKTLLSCINADYNSKELEFNHMLYSYNLNILKDIEEEMNIGFDKMVLNYLVGVNEDKIFYQKDIEDKAYKDTMYLYLKSIVGKRLYLDKDNRLEGVTTTQELIDIINLTDNRKRQQKDIDLLNLYLRKNKYPFVITNNNGKRVTIDGKKYTIWVVGKIDVEVDTLVE